MKIIIFFIFLTSLLSVLSCKEGSNKQPKEISRDPYLYMDTVTKTIVESFDSTEMLFPGHSVIGLKYKNSYFSLDQYLTVIQSKLAIKDTIRMVRGLLLHVDTEKPFKSETFGAKLDSTNKQYILKRVIEHIPVTLQNTSEDTIALYYYGNYFGQLRLVTEAKDQKGVWKQIEYFAALKSDYENRDPVHGKYIGRLLFILPDCTVDIALPKFNGNFRTQLRVKLALGSDTIYSNVFEGSIHAGQFNLPNGLKKPSDIYLGNEVYIGPDVEVWNP